MSKESMPVMMGEEMYHLRFSVRDVVNYEGRYGSIFSALDLTKFGFDTAAKLFWIGMKDQQKDGSLICHFDQNEKGLDDAREWCHKFLGQFDGFDGVSTLYATIMMAFVVSGWLKVPEPQNADKKPADKGDDTPNPKPSRKRSPRKKPSVTS